MNQFKLIIQAFEALPKAPKNRTVMQVSGYPHYENVCSNILAFYLDPEEEHNLNDLLLQSLFKVIKQSQHANTETLEDSMLELPSFKSVHIEREYTTDGNKRIDIVITGDDFVVGIENKIYHWLANDLDDYSDTLNHLAQSGDVSQKEILKTVLGLYPIAPGNINGGFTSITYTSLWREVQQQLGCYLPTASPKWVTYLLDFIETTKQLNKQSTRQDMKLKGNDQFFIDHDKEIEALISERNSFLKRLNRKVTDLFTMLEDEKSTSVLVKAPWIYKKDCLVMDFQFSKQYLLSYDLVIYPHGWELQLLGRNKTSQEYMHRIVEDPNIQEMAPEIQIKDKRLILQTWTIHDELGQILKEILNWIDVLPVVAKSLSSNNQELS